MNLLKNKKVLINLLKQGDVLNTLNGGCVEPQVGINKSNDEFIIQIKAPSVQADAFDIFLDFHRLKVSLYCHHPFKEAALRHPMFSRSFQIPGYVDSDGIYAHYEEESLTIHLPFRKLSQEQRRHIRIEHL